MKFFAGLLWFMVLLVRGVLLWLLIPFAVVAWLTVHWWAQRASVGQAVCWYDQLLWAFLILIPFRLLLLLEPRTRAARFVRPSEMRELKTYRISILNELA